MLYVRVLSSTGPQTPAVKSSRHDDQVAIEDIHLEICTRPQISAQKWQRGEIRSIEATLKCPARSEGEGAQRLGM